MRSQSNWWPGLQSLQGSTRVGSAPDSLTWLLETSVLPTWPLHWLPVATVLPRVGDSRESTGVCLLHRPALGPREGSHDRAVSVDALCLVALLRCCMF